MGAIGEFLKMSVVAEIERKCVVSARSHKYLSETVSFRRQGASDNVLGGTDAYVHSRWKAFHLTREVSSIAYLALRLSRMVMSC